MLKEIKSQQEFSEFSDESGVIVTCPYCGKTYFVSLNEKETDALIKWSERKLLIQDALPNRSRYERELIRYAWSGLPMIACSEECLNERYGIYNDNEENEEGE